MCIDVALYVSTGLRIWDYNMVEVAQMGEQTWAGKSDLISNPDALTYQLNILFNLFGTVSSSAKWGK